MIFVFSHQIALQKYKKHITKKNEGINIYIQYRD